MQGIGTRLTVPALSVLLLGPSLGACNTSANTALSTGSTRGKPMVVSDTERDCLGRAMYFESNRSDSEGLLAVGTVVMNRLENAAFPNGGICSVVGQPRQFATGVLTKPMAEKDLQKVADAADAILAGERHPKVGRAMYFHTAGRKYPYDNMHYVAVAGGNAFYEKRKAGSQAQTPPPASTAMAYAEAIPPAATIAPAGPAQTEVAAAQTVLAEPARDICQVAGLGALPGGG
ncbi:cell wall hydrolase [Methylobacterium sp. E-041]|uniref:cell wall hydrolase n=1 Tax=unclassified Methylobacterium TaxID=2615210 RepID=UPI001FBBB94B|nr:MULTISPECIES: cell wall hydrolase [unclassified Methylobacterium]MCJ2039635.1 cell wall hydrolase [Methylobacterium sp. J-059]MCJ2105933.1 cell wall hydrolase [Methylobacterium sp. E-041]MCJ2113923.1 cell wall hydrolase [Methylobacterium sp. E-025]